MFCMQNIQHQTSSNWLLPSELFTVQYKHWAPYEEELNDVSFKQIKFLIFLFYILSLAFDYWTSLNYITKLLNVMFKCDQILETICFAKLFKITTLSLFVLPFLKGKNIFNSHLSNCKHVINWHIWFLLWCKLKVDKRERERERERAIWLYVYDCEISLSSTFLTIKLHHNQKR